MRDDFEWKSFADICRNGVHRSEFVEDTSGSVSIRDDEEDARPEFLAIRSRELLKDDFLDSASNLDDSGLRT